MSKILFMGDSHGNEKMIKQAYYVAVTHGASRIVSLGDFGSWPGLGGDMFMNYCSDNARASEIPLYVCRGNHDDPARLEYGVALSHDENGHKEISEGVYFLGRTGVWEWDGLKFAVCGGAYSIDRYYRTVGKSWWHEEKITDMDLANLDAALQEKGWDKVDVLITHDAPSSLPPWPGFVKDDPDSAESRYMITKAHKIVKPTWNFCGHYHRQITFMHDDATVMVMSCDEDAAGNWGGDMNSLALFDTEQHSVEVFDLRNLPV